jgi:ATP-dependent Lon protease
MKKKQSRIINKNYLINKKMEIIETKYQLIFQSEDDAGTFEFRIHKNCSQIQLETDINNSFQCCTCANTNYKELEAIRNMIDTILKNYIS